MTDTRPILRNIVGKLKYYPRPITPPDFCVFVGGDGSTCSAKRLFWRLFWGKTP